VLTHASIVFGGMLASVNSRQVLLYDVQVFRVVLHLLPRQPAVAAFMVDFERAVWQALAAEFPDVTVRGCTFHFTQSIWRKVQELGLQKSYMEQRRAHSFIR